MQYKYMLMLESQKIFTITTWALPESNFFSTSVLSAAKCLNKGCARETLGPVHLPKACSVTPRTLLKFYLERKQTTSLRMRDSKCEM